ncbi:MAG: hypothetical protein JWQ71_2843 [Pedosphaera sp.]|nr:hypothetical protein [Pedosphaera sp.]
MAAAVFVSNKFSFEAGDEAFSGFSFVRELELDRFSFGQVAEGCDFLPAHGIRL